MEDELRPIDPETEFVYRRFHQIHFKAELQVPILATAFRPTDSDTDGLSVYRTLFLTPVETLVPVPAEKRSMYYVVRLAVRDLVKLGLSVVPAPIPEGPRGHALIPELTTQAYNSSEKERWKDVQHEMAKLASADIVHRPA